VAKYGTAQVSTEPKPETAQAWKCTFLVYFSLF
jgi:hypothetical protein